MKSLHQKYFLTSLNSPPVTSSRAQLFNPVASLVCVPVEMCQTISDHYVCDDYVDKCLKSVNPSMYLCFTVTASGTGYVSFLGLLICHHTLPASVLN